MSDVLVLNSGSSSLKFAVINPTAERVELRGLCERLGSNEACLCTDGHSQALPGGDHTAALAALIALLSERGLDASLVAVGHRVVHGAERFTGSVPLDDEVVAAITACNHLAPLHNPANLLGIAAAREAFPTLPQVAVFDTAFHAGMPERAFRYAVPGDWYRELGVRRYGFHGTSHRYVSERAVAMLGLGAEHGVITAHLGNGCSACAIANGRSVDTSMGLTPLEGLVMGTRSGDVDPGLFAFLQRQRGLDAEAITAQLNSASGLLALSDGLSNDMRSLLAAEAEGNAAASLAVEVFCYRLAKTISGLSAALARLDALVFTGGIGEHAAAVRSRTLAHLAVLGLHENPAANAIHGADTAGNIASAESRAILVVATDEEGMIAAETLAAIGS
ncbi:MAG: acetate kinase [Planctomycetota bacterium]|jgi:acetate kinase|nr:acetate kinase [Planctomycetota bacterium]